MHIGDWEKYNSLYQYPCLSK